MSILTCRTTLDYILDYILVWPRSKCSSYTVRISYQLLCELETIEGASSSSSAMQKGFWSRIWKLKIPNKMKIFCWRACSEALPTLKNLHRQKVLDSTLCSAYGEHEESTLHALWNYAIVQPIWGPRFNALRSDAHEFSSFSDLVCMIGQHQEL